MNDKAEVGLFRLYIIRHADPDYPNNTITAAGHVEAKLLSSRLAALGLDRIYVSPMGRAMDTMRYTSELLGLPYKVEEWTKELHLVVDDTPHGQMWNIPGEVIRSQNPLPTHETWKELEYFRNPIVHETFTSLQANSDEFLERQGFKRVGGKYRILRPNQDRVAVFCHGGFGLTWLAHLLEIPLPLVWCGFGMPSSSVTTILFEQRSADWATPRCIGFGDISHLYETGL